MKNLPRWSKPIADSPDSALNFKNKISDLNPLNCEVGKRSLRTSFTRIGQVVEFLKPAC
jgi:hypothetical protein